MPYPTKTDLSVLWEYCEEHGKNPRVHPNGFIQLDIADVEDGWDESKKRGHSGAAVRLHVWNPPGIELPRQKTVNEIHDHVFDMKSQVLVGRLKQSLYSFVLPPAGDDAEIHRTHEKWRAVYDKASSSRLEATGEIGRLQHQISFWIGPGQSYEQAAFTFHDSTPDGLVVTRMIKTEVHDGDAHVVCPVGHNPDNSFDRAKAADPDLLWEAIKRSLIDAA